MVVTDSSVTLPPTTTAHPFEAPICFSFLVYSFLVIMCYLTYMLLTCINVVLPVTASFRTSHGSSASPNCRRQRWGNQHFNFKQFRVQYLVILMLYWENISDSTFELSLCSHLQSHVLLRRGSILMIYHSHRYQ